jgi:hypothetical protein
VANPTLSYWISSISELYKLYSLASSTLSALVLAIYACSDFLLLFLFLFLSSLTIQLYSIFILGNLVHAARIDFIASGSSLNPVSRFS